MYKSILHEWFDLIWNQGNEDAVHRLLAPDAVLHNLAQDGKDSHGPADFLAFFAAFREAFPNIHIDVHETAMQDEIVCGRWTVKATHQGIGLGFAPTQRPISFDGMSLARVRDGRIVEGWNIWDAAAMREQLGFITTLPVD
jgi:steroid delta-isomerase-like uncharacterized protein